MVRRDVVVDWRLDGRTQYIHEFEESLSLTNQHLNCCGINKWKIVKNYKQTITRKSNNNLCPNCCWRSISWMLVVRHKTTEVQWACLYERISRRQNGGNVTSSKDIRFRVSLSNSSGMPRHGKYVVL